MNKKYLEEYAGFLIKRLDLKRDLKVVFDCSNGVTGPIMRKIADCELRIRAIFINERPDGNFPGHGPNPLKPRALNQLTKRVVKERADLGIAFDGDGDRAILVDNLGRVIWGDQDAYLLVQYLKPKKIIIDPRIGWLIRDLQNVKVIDTKVGEFFVYKKMIETKADIGFEESGHVYFKEMHGGDSGILTAIYAMNAVSRLPYTLADFCDLLPKYYREGKNFKLRIADCGLIENIEKKYAKCNRISNLDGIRVESSNEEGRFWFNIRMSNTEPLLRIIMEAEDELVLKNELSRLTKFIQKGIK